VPELPDLAIVADAAHAVLGGRPVVDIRVLDPIVLRATEGEAAALVGQVVREVRRRGKHLVIGLERHDIWAAPMLTGRFALVQPHAGKPRAAVTLVLGARGGPPPAAAAWTAGTAWLPADDAPVELRYLDPTRMGKLYLVPAGDSAPVPGVADLGPDVDDPALTLDAWRDRIRRHPGELKSLLRNQAFIAGLGNAYSDEVLWSAGLHPFRRRSGLADAEVDALWGATRSTVAAAVEVLRARGPPTFERQVRDHLAVHLKGGQPCPRCGTTISQVGRREPTSFCRSCQR
jgi:formamidopyrimidine-DNA glycosylase